jgi:hypothetical protein
MNLLHLVIEILYITNTLNLICMMIDILLVCQDQDHLNFKVDFLKFMNNQMSQTRNLIDGKIRVHIHRYQDKPQKYLQWRIDQRECTQ